MQVSILSTIFCSRGLISFCCFRTDIIFAFQHGGPTSFFRDRMHHVRTSMWTHDLRLDRNISSCSNLNDRLDPYLHDIFLDVMSMCSLFNQLGSKTVDYMIFLEALISLCYRLLKFRSMSNASTLCDGQSAYHIGLTIFMMTMFLQYDRRRLINYSLVPVCLENVVQDESREHGEDFSLWLLTIGGIWISDEPNNRWLAPRLRMMAQRLGLDSWEEAQDSIRQYPWITGLHDQPGRELWNRVHNID